MEGEVEKHFYCPYCGSEISMLFDISAGGQKYIEDCEVCCRPIEIKFSMNDGELDLIHVQRLDA